MEKLKIEQVEPRLADDLETPLKATLKKLGYSVPEGFRLRVSLLYSNGNKKYRNSGAHTWIPESEPMRVWLEATSAEQEILSREVAQVSRPTEASPVPDDFLTEASGTTAGAKVFVHSAEVELLRALDRAESTPGWTFVSLKKFRDEILPSDVPSIRSDVERESVLRSAIEKRLILKKPVPNPKSPQFPVTSIRVNRLMPAVQEVLEIPKRNLDFHPIHIKGEPLSAIILRERR